jgi:hypothetical protein
MRLAGQRAITQLMLRPARRIKTTRGITCPIRRWLRLAERRAAARRPAPYLADVCRLGGRRCYRGRSAMRSRLRRFGAGREVPARRRPGAEGTSQRTRSETGGNPSRRFNTPWRPEYGSMRQVVVSVATDGGQRLSQQQASISLRGRDRRSPGRRRQTAGRPRAASPLHGSPGHRPRVRVRGRGARRVP